MAPRIQVLGALLVSVLAGASLPDWYARELPDAQVEARLVREPAEIRNAAGDSLEGEVVMVELRVRPLYGSKLRFQREHFLLRARNNNATSTARSPERIAGSAVLDLTAKRTSSSGSVFSDSTNAPIWGGVPGTGQRPRRLGLPPNAVGGGGSTEGTQTAQQRRESENPVLERLLRIELPLVAEDKPVEGFLYFEIPAKTKRKHLELSYDGPLGEFLIEFKRPD